MYEISPIWKPYYMEPEPERRALLLERLLKEEADDGGNAWRKRLFSLRHEEKGAQGISVDRYLWQCVNFTQIYNTSKLFRKNSRREIEQFFEECGFNEAISSGDEGQKALYWEIRNAAKRYFITCKGSEYRRTLFGLLSPGSADQKEQTCKDVWKMTIGVQKRFDLDGAIQLWTQAVQDEYCTVEPAAPERMKELSLKMKA